MKDIVKINNVLLDFFDTTFIKSESIEQIRQVCLNEIDGLFRHLFRGGNTKAEKKELINYWCNGTEYKEFCQKYAVKNNIFLADPSKVYKYYNKKTWLERKLVKLLSR